MTVHTTSFDRAFDQIARSFIDSRATAPLVKGAWRDDTYVITVDLPGVPASDVTVDVTGTVLSLGARIDGRDWSRSIRLGSQLDPESVAAHHLDGRLTVRISAYAAPTARSITVSTEAPAIENTEVELDAIDDVIEA